MLPQDTYAGDCGDAWGTSQALCGAAGVEKGRRGECKRRLFTVDGRPMDVRGQGRCEKGEGHARRR